VPPPGGASDVPDAVSFHRQDAKARHGRQGLSPLHLFTSSPLHPFTHPPPHPFTSSPLHLFAFSPSALVAALSPLCPCDGLPFRAEPFEIREQPSEIREEPFEIQEETGDFQEESTALSDSATFFSSYRNAKWRSRWDHGGLFPSKATPFPDSCHILKDLVRQVKPGKGGSDGTVTQKPF
jgi:hypothetical protein